MFKVGVVEDNHAEVFLLKEAQRDAQFKDEESFVYFEEGKSLLSYLENKNDLDLILLDLNLPIMNGFEVLDKVKHSLKIKTPVFIFTNSNNPYDRKNCMEIGADGYIQKPFNYTKLVDLLTYIRENLQTNTILSAFKDDEKIKHFFTF